MSIRQLSPELQIKAEQELYEIPSRINHDLNQIRDWICMQPHLNIRAEDQWLINFLRGCKYSLERTKQKLDMYYSMRTLVPEIFKNRDPLDPNIQKLMKLGCCLPVIDKSDITEPVYFVMSYPMDVNTNPFDAIKLIMMMYDILLNETDILTINGIVHVENFAQLSNSYAMKLTPTILKKYMMCIQEAYPVRVKQGIVFNIPKIMKPVLTVVKLCLSEKLRKRVIILGDISTEELHNFVPRKILPKEYGGENSSLTELTMEWKKKVESYREWFLQDAEYCSDESKRPGKPRSSSEMFGIEGSFRKLDID